MKNLVFSTKTTTVSVIAMSMIMGIFGVFGTVPTQASTVSCQLNWNYGPTATYGNRTFFGMTVPVGTGIRQVGQGSNWSISASGLQPFQEFRLANTNRTGGGTTYNSFLTADANGNFNLYDNTLIKANEYGPGVYKTDLQNTSGVTIASCTPSFVIDGPGATPTPTPVITPTPTPGPISCLLNWASGGGRIADGNQTFFGVRPAYGTGIRQVGQGSNWTIVTDGLQPNQQFRLANTNLTYGGTTYNGFLTANQNGSLSFLNNTLIKANEYGPGVYKTDLQNTSGVTIASCAPSFVIEAVSTPTLTVTPIPELFCQPVEQTVVRGQNANFYTDNLHGGGVFAQWSAPDGNPNSGFGTIFSTVYNTLGRKTVTASARGLIRTCFVNVISSVTPTPTPTPSVTPTPTPSPTPTPTPTPSVSPLTCSPVFRQINIGETINYTAGGGRAPLNWTAGTFANPNIGSGSNFTTAFSTSGFKTINLTSADGQSVGCSVLVSDVIINPTPTPTAGFSALTINKTVRNISSGGGEYDSVSARPNETVEFVINIYSSGNSASSDVRVFDSLPAGLRYQNGTSKIDGSLTGDSITYGSGLSLGNLNPGRNLTIRFQAIVENNAYFNYNAISLVNRATVTASNTGSNSDTALVNVSRTNTVIDSGSFSVQKLGRDITRGENAEQGSLVGNPGDTLEFIVHIRSLSGNALYNVMVRDFLPSGLTYINRTTSVDGTIVSDGIVGGGINVGTLSPNQERIIRLSALVGGNDSFTLGTTSISNTVQVNADNATALSVQIPISIFKGKVISNIGKVPTGGETIIIAALISAMLAYTLTLYGQTYFAQKRGVLGVIRKHANNPDKFNFI